MEKIKPKEKREHVFREYDDVYTLLRKIFNIPQDEMLLNFEWDKNRGGIVVETIKD